MRMALRWSTLACTATFVVACVNDSAAPPVVILPTITSAIAAANPNNVLSATVSVHVTNSDSIAVSFSTGDAKTTADTITPAIAAVGDSAVVPVFGLLPAHRYTFRAIAYGSGRITKGDAVEFITGELPSDLPQYTADGADPLPGYIVFAAGSYGVVIDNTGRVVWYRRFPNGPGLNFMAEPNGHYVARPQTPDPSDIENWIELDPLGNISRTLGCGAGLQPRPHDLISVENGGYWLMCDETRTMDLTTVGGVQNARVTGTDVEHLDASGKVLFHWSAFDHFDITDGEPADRTGVNVNWTHGNAIDFDTDGNLLVSFRNLSEVTKIDSNTGAVIWRMGGRRNQFTFVGSPTPAFMGQHSARSVAAGTFMILDNLGTAHESRAERYTVDEATHTATLASSYSSVPGVVTLIGGSVQRLSAGRTLVSFGTAGRVEEYDATGRMTWHIDGNPGYVFRAERIQSLYAPGVGSAR